jgi:excisionase family DNA binding protein
MPNEFNHDRLAPVEAADLLGVSTGTLEVWRCTQRYPLPYYKVGRKVFYRRSDVNAFLEARRCEPGEAA